MPLIPYCCTNCGFWQRYFEAPPPACPVCTDFRHPLPEKGWRFLTPEEVAEETQVSWREVAPGVFMFAAEPAVGIGSCGYLIAREEGNVAFEGAGWYSGEALDFIEEKGGVDFLSASHAHVYGALWRLADRFRPEIVMQHEALPFAQATLPQRKTPEATPVSWPFDEEAEPLPGMRLLHTGGHMPGHTVLYLPDEQALFCGDALKFKLDTTGEDGSGNGRIGRARAISCHAAFDAHIPLPHSAVRRYREVFEKLDFDAVFTPWEVVRPGQNKRAALRLFEKQLGGKPFADDLPLAVGTGRPTGEGAGDPEPVRRYREMAPAGQTMEFPITGLDHLGIPVWTATLWESEREMSYGGIGYGATEAQARIGAWGEMTEGIGAHRGLRRLPRRTASFEKLRKEGVPAVNPLKLRLPVGTAYTHAQEVEWIEARRYPSRERVWVPAEAAASNLFDLGAAYAAGERDPLFLPVTNGLGAGDSLGRALLHGLLELVQRDGNSAGYRALDREIGLDLDSVADPAIRRLLAHYDAEGIDLRAKLAGITCGLVSLYVVGTERDLGKVPHPIMLTGCGEGADPDREVALKKALLEYSASRARKLFNHGPIAPMAHLFPEGYLERIRAENVQPEEGRSLEHMRRWMGYPAEKIKSILDEQILCTSTRRRFSGLPTVAPGTLSSTEAKLRHVAGRFLGAGLDVLYVDFLEEGGPARVVKAIVPGLEVETVTYYRIGPRNLRRLLKRGSGLVGRGAPPEGARRIPLAEDDEERLGGPAWLNVAGLDQRMERLYAMYREPGRHELALVDGE